MFLRKVTKSMDGRSSRLGSIWGCVWGDGGGAAVRPSHVDRLCFSPHVVISPSPPKLFLLHVSLPLQFILPREATLSSQAK